MSNQRKFIKKAFELIKNSFEEFTNENIYLIIRNHKKIKSNEKDIIRLEYIDKGDHINYFIYMIDDCSQFLDKQSKFYKSLSLESEDILEPLNIITKNDILIKEKAIIIMFLLHEFGHISHVKKFMNFSIFNNLRSINDQALYLFMNTSKDENINIGKQFLFGEHYAEMFKFKHFYKIWKQLQ